MKEGRNPKKTHKQALKVIVAFQLVWREDGEGSGRQRVKNNYVQTDRWIKLINEMTRDVEGGRILITIKSNKYLNKTYGRRDEVNWFDK